MMRAMAGAMITHRLRLFLIILIACLVRPVALARQNGPCYYPTIEYFVADASLVVRGVVTAGPVVLTVPADPPPTGASTPGTEPAAETRYEKLSIVVAETLRRDTGVVAADPTGQTLEFLVEQFEGASPGRRWNGREMLLSLRSTSGWRPHKLISPELCPWMIRLDWGSDNNHNVASFFWWAYDLTSNDLVAYDISGLRVRSSADVLTRAREAAAFQLPPLLDEDTYYWTAGTGRRFADVVPVDQSDHYLYAPVDVRLEAQGRRWLSRMHESDHAWRHVRAAFGALRRPHEAQTVELLQQIALTAPPAPGQWEGDQRWRVPVYDARRWARRVLMRWQTPPGAWSETFEYRLPMRPVGLWPALVLLLPLVTYLALWRWRRRRGRRFGFVSGALATLMIVAAAMWVRSFWNVDELWYGQAAERHELVSNAGRLQLLTVRYWDEPFPLMYGSADRAGDTDRALSWETMKEIERGRLSRGGVLWATGNTPPWASQGKLLEYVAAEDQNGPDYNGTDWPRPRDESTNPMEDFIGGGLGMGGAGGLFGPSSTPGKAYPFTFLSIPWLYFAVIGALGPLSWLHASWRSRRWRFAGLCGNCGYDLRATPSDCPCPECGDLRSFGRHHAAGPEAIAHQPALNTD